MSGNRDLYIKTRDAFRKAWFVLPTNKPCSYYTKEILGNALASTHEIESNKVKAASVMIHVLNWANWVEPKYNPKPDFAYNDLMEYTKGPLADPKIIGNTEETSTDNDVNTGSDESSHEPEIATHESVKEQEEIKTNNNMKTNLRAEKPICMLDPETLGVMKTYDSVNAAHKEHGNIYRAIENKGLCDGHYWCYPDDVSDFKPKEKDSKEKPKKKTATQKPSGSNSAKMKLLEDYTDIELRNELRRRGYSGTLSKIKTLEI